MGESEKKKSGKKLKGDLKQVRGNLERKRERI